VDGIIRQCAGRVVLDSEPGWGTRFHIYFPRACPGSEETSAESKPAGREAPSTILVVADEPAQREILSTYLTELGYRVLEARSADEALRMAASAGPALHLLLTDIVMPGMSGVELAHRLEQTLPSLRTIFMSGYSDGKGLGPDFPALGGLSCKSLSG